MKEKKQYVYIGQYYHLKNKELPLDFKFGVTDNLNQREYSLGRTKSPIKYMLLRAWELPSNVKREKVEKLISTIFDENKYDGCEWYDIDGDVFQDKITTLFEVISEMVDDLKFSFTEVNLDRVPTAKDIIEKEIESEIRLREKIIELDPWDATNYLQLLKLYKGVGELSSANLMLAKINSFASGSDISIQAEGFLKQNE